MLLIFVLITKQVVYASLDIQLISNARVFLNNDSKFLPISGSLRYSAEMLHDFWTKNFNNRYEINPKSEGLLKLMVRYFAS